MKDVKVEDVLAQVVPLGDEPTQAELELGHAVADYVSTHRPGGARPAVAPEVLDELRAAQTPLGLATNAELLAELARRVT